MVTALALAVSLVLGGCTKPTGVGGGDATFYGGGLYEQLMADSQAALVVTLDMIAGAPPADLCDGIEGLTGGAKSLVRDFLVRNAGAMRLHASASAFHVYPSSRITPQGDSRTARAQVAFTPGSAAATVMYSDAAIGMIQSGRTRYQAAFYNAILLGYHEIGHTIQDVQFGFIKDLQALVAPFVSAFGGLDFLDAVGQCGLELVKRRLPAPGIRDFAFGSNGFALSTTSVRGAPDFHAVKALAGGKLVAAGTGLNESGQAICLVAKWNADGTPDLAFGDGGTFVSDPATLTQSVGNACFGIVASGDGGYYAAGIDYPTASHTRMLVLKLTARGRLDTSFNGTGALSLEVGTGQSYAFAVLDAPNNGVVLAGSATGSAGEAVMAAVSVTAAGGLDTGFGDHHDGKALVALAPEWGSQGIAAYAAARGASGEIFLAGDSVLSTNAQHARFAVVKLKADGTIDSDNFGTKGLAQIDFGSAIDAAKAITVLPDGRLVLAGVSPGIGLALSRHLASGALDSTFGNGGKLTLLTDQANASILSLTGLEQGGDGRLLVSGFYYDGTYDRSVLFGLTPDGGADASFNATGVVKMAVNTDLWAAWGIARTPDGMLIVAGTRLTGGAFSPALMRYFDKFP